MTVVHPDVETISEQSFSEMFEEWTENNDPNLRTHIINPPMNIHIYQPGMRTAELVAIARAQQLEIVALCGYKFVPKHNPANYDTCVPCSEEAAKIDAGMGK